MGKIGLVISGMPLIPMKGETGYNNDIVTISKVEEVTQMLRDVRDLCQNGNPNFYSLEKTQNYTLFTIYNPNTFDHVSRDAYIAITLFINKNETIVGNVTDKLNELMNLYIANENNISDGLFLENINSCTTQPLQATALYGTKEGFKKYESLSEINSILNTAQTKNFRKLYFFDTNIQIESNSNYVDYDSELKHNVIIRNINGNKHRIYLNNKQLKIEWSNTEVSIPAFNHDKIIIQEGTKTIEEFNVTSSIDFTIPAPIARPAPIASQPKWYKKYALHMGVSALVIVFTVLIIIKLTGNEVIEDKDKDKTEVIEDKDKTEVIEDKNNNEVIEDKDKDKTHSDNITKKKEDLYNPEKGVYWGKYKQFYFIEDDKWYGMKLTLTNGDSIREKKILRNGAESINGLNDHFKHYMKKPIKLPEKKIVTDQVGHGSVTDNDEEKKKPISCDDLCEDAKKLLDSDNINKEDAGVMLKKLSQSNCHCDDEIKYLKDVN